MGGSTFRGGPAGRQVPDGRRRPGARTGHAGSCRDGVLGPAPWSETLDGVTNVNGQRQEYRLKPAVGLRMAGVGCLWLAGAVALEALARAGGAFDSLPFDVLRWTCFVVFVLVTLCGAVIALARRPWLVLDAEGFRNRLARPGQVRAAAWKEVTDVRRGPGGTLVLALSGDRMSSVPTSLLSTGAQEISAAVSARLNDAHGYRAAR